MRKYLHGGTPVCSSSTARAVVLAAILPHISEFVGCPSVQTISLWCCDSRGNRGSNGASAYDKSQNMKHCTCINIMLISCDASDTYHSIYMSQHSFSLPTFHRGPHRRTDCNQHSLVTHPHNPELYHKIKNNYICLNDNNSIINT